MTMSLIGPHGISAASSAVSQSAVERSREALGEDRAKLGTPLDPVAVRGEPRIPRQAVQPEGGAQPWPLACRPDRDRDRTVGRGKGLVRHDIGVGVAEPAGRHAADERVLRLVHEAGHRGAEQRDVDPLATTRHRTSVPLAPDERGQDADRAEHPRHDVADRDADLRRTTALVVGRPGDRHQAAGRLDHEVVAGPGRGRAGRPIARDRQVDEPRVDGLERRVIEPEPGEPPDSCVLDQDVAVGEEPAQDRHALGRLEVQAHPALVAVDGQVIGGRPSPLAVSRADPGRAPAPGRVTLGRLDLDDLRAQVAEEHRAVRPGQDRRAIDDAQSRERAGCGVGTGGVWAGGHRRPMVAAVARTGSVRPASRGPGSRSGRNRPPRPTPSGRGSRSRYRRGRPASRLRP